MAPFPPGTLVQPVVAVVHLTSFLRFWREGVKIPGGGCLASNDLDEQEEAERAYKTCAFFLPPRTTTSNFSTTITFMFPPQRQGLLDGRMQSVHPEGDAAIRQTDSDAILARYSAVQKGYLTDPFVRPLLPRGGHLQPSRPPLINIGTYVRSEGIDKLVYQWLDLSSAEGKQCQIVSLGAGSDTRFWRLAVRIWIAAYAKFIVPPHIC